MTIAEWSVKYPVAVVMRIASLVLLGLVCLYKLPVDLLPKVSLPTVGVSTTWPNVSPEVMETQITRPLEESLSTVSGLYTIQSTSSEGSSSVRVQFDWGVDIGQAAVDTLQLVQRAQHSFPTDPTNTLQMPTVSKFDPTQMPILVFGVSGINDPVKLRTLLDNQITPIIESADGVASATSNGGLQRAIIVDVNPEQMRAHDLSLAQIGSRLAAENVNLPAGIGKQGATEYIIRSLGWFNDVGEIAQMPIAAVNGQVIHLGEVAQVRDAYQEQRIYSRLDGNPAVGMTVTQQSGANTIATSKAVAAQIVKIQKIYPKLKFGVAYNQAEFVQDSVNDVMMSAIIGGTLAILILLFFLRNINSTLVVAFSIPTSIISTFALIYMCGFTLNTMSLGGLALSTGLIVDDAVVVLENIFRHIERDKRTPRDAAVFGTNEILSAVFASTWTVMVVFLPLLFIKGQSGQMFTQFALVVIFSLSVSLLDASTVVPMLATFLISGEAHHELLNADASHESWLMRLFAVFGQWFTTLDTNYRKMLNWALHHRWQTLGGALLIVGSSCLLIPLLGTEMMPVSDTGNLSIRIKLPPGTALEKTNNVMLQIEDIVHRNPNVETEYASAGANIGMGGGAGTAISNTGSVTIKLKDKHKQATNDVVMDMQKKFGQIPGVRPNVSQVDIVSRLMTGGDTNVDVDIFGPDLNTLYSNALTMIDKLRDVPGLTNLDVNWLDATPEIQWKVDRDKAMQLEVSFSDVANTINTATNGATTTYYQEQGFEYPIIVQMPEKTRKTIDEMESLVVRSSAPGTSNDILLSQVATPIVTMGPSQITRQDRQRYIEVSGTPQGRSSGDVQKDIQKILDAQPYLPTGYYWDWGVNQKRQAEEFGGMPIAIFLAIGLIYMLLAAQFESFIHPLTILFSVPLAVTGVILALFLTDRSFGLTAFIGVLMLIGIVVKNGILLVSYTNQLREAGMGREEAVLTASPTRLRPILMTACAAMLGMLPIAIGLGKGSEIQAPMATAVIGGLLTSTMLTLLVVPTVYTVFDDISNRFAARKGKKT